MSQIKEWQDFQNAYSNVRINEQTSRTDDVLSWLIGNNKISKYINTQTVLARQAQTSETIKEGTVLVQKGDWIILKEKQIFKLIQPEFEFLYESESPVSGSGVVKMFQLKRRRFWGAVYEGKSLTISDSKNSTILLESGDIIGAHQPTITKNNFLVIKKETHFHHFKKLAGA